MYRFIIFIILAIHAASSAVWSGPNYNAGCALDLDYLTHDYGSEVDGIESEITGVEGREIVVAVVALQAVELDTWQVSVTYDPECLEFTGGYEEYGGVPNFMRKEYGSVLWMPPVERIPGEAVIAAALIGDSFAQSPDGSGAIGFLKFRIRDLSETISLNLAEVQFLSASGGYDRIMDLKHAAIIPPDTIRPVVKISADETEIDAAGIITVTFSEPVTGFTASDIRISNGGLSLFSGDGQIYQFTLTTDKKGAVTVDIPDNAASDQADNGNIRAEQLVLECIKNAKPVISGEPPTKIQVGEIYRFTPETYDSDGDELVFTVENEPDWAKFNPAEGSLQGMPEDRHEGVTAGIVITATDIDGESDTLGPFEITVVKPPADDNPDDGAGQGEPAENDDREETPEPESAVSPDDGATEGAGETGEDPPLVEEGNGGGSCFMDSLLF